MPDAFPSDKQAFTQEPGAFQTAGDVVPMTATPMTSRSTSEMNRILNERFGPSPLRGGGQLINLPDRKAS